VRSGAPIVILELDVAALARRSPAVRLIVLALCALAVLLWPGRAPAQTQPPPPSVLSAVAVNEAGPAETRILLTFGPLAPRFSIIAGEGDRPSIAFAQSSQAPTARAPSGLRGLVRNLAFEQNDTILILNLGVAAPARLTATPVGERAISLTVVPVPRPDETARAPGPLPRTAPPPPGADGFELVPLKYADVSEVVGLLTAGLTVRSNDSFTPHEPAFGSAGMGGGGAFQPIPPPNLEPANQPLAQSVDETIGVDRRLNAIVLKGPPERIAVLKQRIAQIDVPVESVVLETIFVELTESGARNVGLDFNNANSQLAVATFQTGAYIPPGTWAGDTLTSASLQAAIYAQVSKGNGRIVSKPRISAQSGSSAKIITGDALPILTSITLSGVNGVSQQVQYVNVGVTLQIAPRVSSDGFVSSHVFCVVSSVTGFSQGYPTISQREAETSATVRDGETFVIGGLTQENELSSTEKIPGLGDVPVLGEMFRMRRGTRSKTDLYIVVTPRVVKRGELTPPAAPLPDPQPGG
jgi:general secretion pathway protein D